MGRHARHVDVVIQHRAHATVFGVAPGHCTGQADRDRYHRHQRKDEDDSQWQLHDALLTLHNAQRDGGCPASGRVQKSAQLLTGP